MSAFAVVVVTQTFWWMSVVSSNPSFSTVPSGIATSGCCRHCCYSAETSADRNAPRQSRRAYLFLCMITFGNIYGLVYKKLAPLLRALGRSGRKLYFGNISRSLHCVMRLRTWPFAGFPYNQDLGMTNPGKLLKLIARKSIHFWRAFSIVLYLPESIIYTKAKCTQRRN